MKIQTKKELETELQAVANVLTKEQDERATAAFQRVLDTGRPSCELARLHLLPDEDETYISREIERMCYEPELANAGELERKWVKRLREMSTAEFWKKRVSAAAFAEDDEGEKSVKWLCYQAQQQARRLSELLPAEAFGRDRHSNPGRYYFWTPVTMKTDKVKYKWFAELGKAAAEAREWDVKWFAEIMIGGTNQPGGIPEGCSDFGMDALCGLRKWNGEVIRMVRLRNIRGEESEITPLESESFKSPEHFREWCLKQGGFAWSGNQTHIQVLHSDTNAKIAWRYMNEVDAMGWHPIQRKVERASGPPLKTWDSATPGLLAGVWFYGDCAYYEGQLLEMDRDKIYTVEGEGYFVSERGRESEYALGMPRLHPGVKLGDLLTLRALEDFKHKPAPLPVAEQTAAQKGEPMAFGKFSEAELLKSFFEEVSHRLYETCGGYESHLAMGAVFAYAAAPEIFVMHGLFPGLFVHGQMSGGKTKFTEWLMHLVGFDSHGMKAGISAIKSTAVGILQESQNYSNLPLWIDEFRQGQVGEDKVGIFRDAYNRQPPVKWNPEGIQRKIRTAYVISGESTSSDAATRSRYPHVQISASRRINNHLAWFDAHKKHLFVFQRLLMERRAEFVAELFKYLHLWVSKSGSLNEREKMVHGIDWAAYRAMADLLGAPPVPGEFDDFVMAHMRHASVDVTEETNINVFWTDLIAAFNAGAIPSELFFIKSELVEYPQGQRWQRVTMYLETNGVLSAVAAHLRKAGGTMSLRRNDLRDQLSKTDYWVPGKHRQRFGGPESKAGGIPAWAILLDNHPLGRQDVTEEEFKASLTTAQRGLDAEVAVHVFADGDPRMGPLFAIVDAVEGRRREEEKTRG